MAPPGGGPVPHFNWSTFCESRSERVGRIVVEVVPGIHSDKMSARPAMVQALL
jgi:hypothetical protein